jgi:hypothetical protein
MRLTRQPSPPRPTGFYTPRHYLNTHSEWQKFLTIENC